MEKESREVKNISGVGFNLRLEFIDDLLIKSPEMWVLFKESDDQFTSIESGTAGLAYYSYYPDNKEMVWGQIIMNFTINQWSNHNFRQVLMHEFAHIIGFEHTEGSDVSVMNYDYVYGLDGLSDLDYDRLHEKYPFSLHLMSFKDLERLGSNSEDTRLSHMADSIMANYGLSEDRSLEVSRLLSNLKKSKKGRNLTNGEKRGVRPLCWYKP